jgi:hypothetical protein
MPITISRPRPTATRLCSAKHQAVAASGAVIFPPRKSRLLPQEKTLPRFCLEFVATESQAVNVARAPVSANGHKHLALLEISHAAAGSRDGSHRVIARKRFIGLRNFRRTMTLGVRCGSSACIATLFPMNGAANGRPLPPVCRKAPEVCRKTRVFTRARTASAGSPAANPCTAARFHLQPKPDFPQLTPSFFCKLDDDVVY